MKIYNLSHLIELRHWFHKNAEISLEEFNTSKRIMEELKLMGLKDSEIQIKAKTGLQVDIKGTGSPRNTPKTICLRADIDGLAIKENNPEIGTT